MLATMNWKEFLPFLLREFRLSSSEFESITGVSNVTVSNIKSGRNKSLTQNTISKIEDKLSIKIDDSDPENITFKKLSKLEITFEGTIPVNQYPLLATVYAGEPALLEHEIFDETVPFAYIKPGHKCFALRVSGHSMDTTLKDGDLILVDMDVPLADGCLVAVKLKNGNQYIKRYYDTTYGILKLTSDNSEYGVKLIDKQDIAACHRVVSVSFAI